MATLNNCGLHALKNGLDNYIGGNTDGFKNYLRRYEIIDAQGNYDNLSDKEVYALLFK